MRHDESEPMIRPGQPAVNYSFSSGGPLSPQEPNTFSSTLDHPQVAPNKSSDFFRDFMRVLTLQDFWINSFTKKLLILACFLSALRSGAYVVSPILLARPWMI